MAANGQQARVLEVIQESILSSVTLRQSENLATGPQSTATVHTHLRNLERRIPKEPRRSPERSTLSILLVSEPGPVIMVPLVAWSAPALPCSR